MSEDINIPSEPRVAPMGEDSLEDDGESPEDATIATRDSQSRTDTVGDALNVSPEQQSKKKKNKRKKCNKENAADINKSPKVKGKEGIDAKIDPKEGKTKVNMERQREITSSQTAEVDTDADGKIEREKLEVEDGVNKEDDDCLDIPPADQLDGNARNQLYQRGMTYFNSGKKNAALKCFMACLTGVVNKDGFAFLPQCLKHMADIYYSREEYEKAIQFIQAEKMYYETALINTPGLQKELEENMEKKKDSPVGDVSEDPAVHRAEEYENLSRLCLDKQQAELALEYQGKATKLRQQLYGADHPLTKKSLDFFTVVYAEVGKQQYTESLQKFSDKPPEDSSSGEVSPEGEPEPNLRRRRSILRTPSQSDDSAKNKDRRVRFEEPEQVVRNRQRREEELWISQTIMWVLFVVCVVTLTCMLVYLYCRLDSHSHTCLSWKAQVNYYYMRIKYFYYTWGTNSSKTFG